MAERRPAEPNVRDVLERWRDLVPRPRGNRAFTDHDAVADLIASHLDSYAYEHLSKTDRAWWEEAWNADEEAGAFSRLFGPEWILEMMDGFLGWFLIRKVAASHEDLVAYPVLCRDLVEWLVTEELVAPELAADARARADRAAEELPLTDELADLLYRGSDELELTEFTEIRDWVDQRAAIVRTEPGALWFRSDDGEEVGPVRVPEGAVEIARIGWSLSAASFGRSPEGWHILEMGNVYPN